MRRAAGMTQTEVAARLNRPQSFVAKYESGERRLDVVEFIEIAEAIGFDPVAVLKQVVEMSPGDSATPEMTARAQRALGGRVVRKKAARRKRSGRPKGAVSAPIVEPAPGGTPTRPRAR